ncbi:MAG: hypothetical protein MUO18_05215 [Methanomassiliicoccales archaeon]|nr:hypothetical protein [Methanomassiliicoccales archaeon]
MKDGLTRRRFVELRAQGSSFTEISKKLCVSKTTLIGWSQNLCEHYYHHNAQR